jgi:hypothetical protein
MELETVEVFIRERLELDNQIRNFRPEVKRSKMFVDEWFQNLGQRVDSLFVYGDDGINDRLRINFGDEPDSPRLTIQTLHSEDDARCITAIEAKWFYRSSPNSALTEKNTLIGPPEMLKLNNIENDQRTIETLWLLEQSVQAAEQHLRS